MERKLPEKPQGSIWRDASGSWMKAVEFVCPWSRKRFIRQRWRIG
ncbi:hypothetical protein [Scytonema sp. HK-05]|nr:hypothetical protein [Scytonema sp. HK-05]